MNIHVTMKLKAVREAQNLTLPKLEAKSGVNNSLIWKIENHKHSPSINTLSKIATALGVGLDDLVEIERT